MPDIRAIRTRQKVLRAVRALLVEEGIDAVSYLRVATFAGVGRRTLYRHWNSRADLLRDALAETEMPRVEGTGGALRDELVRHLESLRVALAEGALVRALAALVERAAVQPDLDRLRRRLMRDGAEPLRARLEWAISAGELPRSLDVEAAAAQLQGPLYYRALVLGEPVEGDAIPPLVDAFLAAHPAPRDSSVALAAR